MRVLVVEDDFALGGFLKRCLIQENYLVQWVGDGEAAIREMDTFNPDLVLLDLGLPKCDGLQVLEEIKARQSDTCVLIISGRVELTERVRCLDLGADDCLLKPFSLTELIARSRAVLRRREQSTDRTIRLGDLEVNRFERRVICAGRDIQLSTKEFALLQYLIVHSGRCVSRTELLEDLWPTSGSSNTNVVDVYINYLRRKLSQHPGVLPMIETVRGIGYRMSAVSSGRHRATHSRVASTGCNSEPDTFNAEPSIWRSRTEELALS